MTRQAKRIPARSSTAEFIVRVASRADVSLQGRIEHVQSGDAQCFRTLLEMVLLIHTKMELAGFPQNTMELRSWSRDT